VQHEGDPVHRLDGQAPAPPRDNWVTVRTDPYVPEKQADRDVGLPVGADQHEASAYSDTAAALEAGDLGKNGYIDPATQEVFNRVRGNQAKFFGDNEIGYTYSGREN
jgi:hypothetical protein